VTWIEQNQDQNTESPIESPVPSSDASDDAIIGPQNQYSVMNAQDETVVESNYRFYDNADDLQPGSPREADNTVSGVGQSGTVGQDFRLRTGFENHRSTSIGGISQTLFDSAVAVAQMILASSSLYVPATIVELPGKLDYAQTTYNNPSARPIDVVESFVQLILQIARARFKPSGGSTIPVDPPTSGAAHNLLKDLMFTLQFAQKTGPSCSTQTSGWLPISATSEIRYKVNPSDSGVLVDITASPNDPAAAAGYPWVYQTYVSKPDNFIVGSVISPQQSALWDFSLTNVSAIPTSSYCFRIVNINDEPLDQYDQYPEIATSADAYLDLNALASVGMGVAPGKMSSSPGTATVSTNMTGSYNLMLSTVGNDNALTHVTHPSYTIPALVSSYTPTNNSGLSGVTSGWGFRVSGLGNFGASTTSELNVLNSAYTWASVPVATSPVQISSGTATDNRGAGGSNSPASTTVFYGTSASVNQVAGQYQANILYTAVANP
jgi:hypothetical protein